MPKPSFTALQALVTFAEQGDIRSAASKLNVSDVAIRQHLHQLNLSIGQALVENRQGRMQLTSLGQRYVQAIQPHLRAIAEENIKFFPSLQPKIVKITADSLITTFWLAPRLLQISSQVPDVDVQMYVTNRLVDLNEHECDLAIRLAIDDLADYECHSLATLHVVALCHPRLVGTNYKFIQYDYFRDAWHYWLKFQPQSAFVIDDQAQHVVEDAVTALKLATMGFGVLLTLEEAAQTYINSGELVHLPHTKPVAVELVVLNAQKSPLKPCAMQIKQFIKSLP